MKNGKKSKRYWVTDDNYIPLSEQPINGYTEIGVVLRAQREVECAMKAGVTLQEAKSWYHIMDASNCEICHNLDNAI